MISQKKSFCILSMGNISYAYTRPLNLRIVSTEMKNLLNWCGSWKQSPFVAEWILNQKRAYKCHLNVVNGCMVMGCHRLLLVLVGHHELSCVLLGCRWLSLVVDGFRCLSLLLAIGCPCCLSMVVMCCPDCCGLSWAVIGFCGLLWSVMGSHWLSWLSCAGIDCHGLSWTAMVGRGLSWAVVSCHG